MFVFSCGGELLKMVVHIQQFQQYIEVLLHITIPVYRKGENISEQLKKSVQYMAEVLTLGENSVLYCNIGSFLLVK